MKAVGRRRSGFCVSRVSGLGFFPPNLSGVLPLFLQSSDCDQPYETRSTGSESNINAEGLERQKERFSGTGN
jgi:hypothetical protein